MSMNMVWDRYLSNGIRELGYDYKTQTMAVAFSDSSKKYHSPVPYDLYASIRHATFPERRYSRIVDGKIPRIFVEEYR